MRVQIGKYIIKNCDERNLVIVEQRPAGKNPKTGEMGTGVRRLRLAITRTLNGLYIRLRI